jgi:hypothetical protein
VQRADEFDVESQYLCILPGLEGHSARFQYVTERLPLAAAALPHARPDLNTLPLLAQAAADVTIALVLKNFARQPLLLSSRNSDCDEP